jgi:hypothetical protein
MLCFLACLTTSPLLADYTYLWSGNDPRFTGRFSISESDFVNREFNNLTAVNFQFHDSQDPSHDVILDSFLDVPPGGSGNEFGFLTSDGQHLDHSKTNTFNPNTSFSVAAWQYPSINVGLYSWNLFGDSVETFHYVNYTDHFFVETTGSWSLPEIAPTIQSSPLTQTVEVGTPVDLSVRATSSSPMFYLWYQNNTNLISSSTNRCLGLANLQFSQSGGYTVVVTNAFGAVTSSPAMLNVIPAVQRRAVPAISVIGETGSSVNVQYADSPASQSSWQALDTVSLINSPQYWFDLSTPLPPQRFYRVSQTGTPAVLPAFKLASMVPAITLAGNIGGSARVDYINAIGPTNAWATLDTVTLTNTSQLYFDVTAPRQPKRFYRLVQIP